MKINWSKTKYILPVVILPFLFLLNYGYQSFSEKDAIEEPEVEPGIRSIGDVSEEVQKKGLANKLEAFKNRFKRATVGQTAIENLQPDIEDTIKLSYQLKEKRLLDSIDKALEFEAKPPSSFSPSNPPLPTTDYQPNLEDREWARAREQLDSMEPPKYTKPPSDPKYDDPMVLFREQMAVIDSISKAGDPLNQPNLDSTGKSQAKDEVPERLPVPVKKAPDKKDVFNTIKVEEEGSFIKAMVDDGIKKGSIGERIRIRILDDIVVGNKSIPKDAYLYAQISGFQDQRIKITISTIMVEDKIMPVNLSIYDLDGLEGLYVPASEFREFSKDLGSQTAGGMNLQMQQDPSSFNQFYMSSLQRMFTSTSQAVSKAIKQNRANLKYGTLIYLVDPENLNQEEPL